MARPRTETAHVTYRVKRGKEDAFLELLGEHWPTLRRLRLVTDEPPLVFRGEDKSKRAFFVELFTWKSAEAVDKAHATPEVKKLWDRMAELVEDRQERPGTEILAVEPMALP